MLIGERLRTVRGKLDLSQGNSENRAGLLRWYISRVENGHTVAPLETLEKIALEMPLYQFLYDGDEPPLRPPVGAQRTISPLISQDYVTPSPECGPRIALYCST